MMMSYQTLIEQHMRNHNGATKTLDQDAHFCIYKPQLLSRIQSIFHSSVHHIEVCRLIIRIEDNLEDENMINVILYD